LILHPARLQFTAAIAAPVDLHQAFVLLGDLARQAGNGLALLDNESIEAVLIAVV